MDNFMFYSPTRFLFGKGEEEKAGAMCAQYGAKKVMIVYGGGSVVRSGLLDRVKASLDKAVKLKWWNMDEEWIRSNSLLFSDVNCLMEKYGISL